MTITITSKTIITVSFALSALIIAGLFGAHLGEKQGAQEAVRIQIQCLNQRISTASPSFSLKDLQECINSPL